MKKNLTVPAEPSLIEAVDNIANQAGMTRTAYLRAIVKYAIEERLEPVVEEVITIKPRGYSSKQQRIRNA